MNDDMSEPALNTAAARRKRRPMVVFIVLGVLLALTIVVSPRVGSSGVALNRVFWTIRVPRLELAMLAGFSLSIAGAVFQSTFRNPLATPFTLGVASGAALFVSIGIKLTGARGEWSSVIQMALATVGALLTMLFVYGVARARRGASTATLLLAGISISFLCSAGIVLIQALANEQEAKEIIRWTMGSVEIVGEGAWRTLVWPAVVALVAAVLTWRQHRELDLLMMGEQVAAGRGVDVGRSRALAYFTASVLTAMTVTLCGPIAFVGLVVPHVMRAIVGPAHAVLIPAVALAGMIFLPICDTLARNALPWLSQAGALQRVGLSANVQALPVGVLTNLLGAAFFLYILLARRTDEPIV